MRARLFRDLLAFLRLLNAATGVRDAAELLHGASPALSFAPPVLINADVDGYGKGGGGKRRGMMYLRGGAQAPRDRSSILIEEKGNSVDWGDVGSVVYSTTDGARSWRPAWNVSVPGERAFKTVLVPTIDGQGLHDLAFWPKAAGAFPLDERISAISASGVQYYRHSRAAGKWELSWQAAENITFDLAGHQVWRAKAAGTTIEQPAFALDQMDASVACFPDGECVLAVTVQWGGNPSSWAITSDSIIALVAQPPYIAWHFRGVVANASQYRGARDGYSEGPNENAMVLLPDNETLMLVFRDESEGPPATTPESACDECSYTRVTSTSRGKTWSVGEKMPAGVGAVTPTLLLLRRSGTGRAGPLLLSGGRQNTSFLTGNRSSHNYDNVLWVSWDGWGTEWETFSLSYRHNLGLSPSAPPSHRYTDRTNSTWKQACKARESSAATSLFQVGEEDFVVLYPQFFPAEPLGAEPACTTNPTGNWDGGIGRGWSMRVHVAGFAPPPPPAPSPPPLPKAENFSVLWNADYPGECLKFCEASGTCLHRDYTVADFGIYNITANENGFAGNQQGENIVILYSPPLGLYPYLHDDGRPENGGLPQVMMSNSSLLAAHLSKWAVDVSEMLPDKSFSGIAAIDWESWAPVWAWNGVSGLYQTASRHRVKTAHPEYNTTEVEAAAKQEFETAARQLHLQTLAVAKQIRPFARFGFYDCERGQLSHFILYARLKFTLSLADPSCGEPVGVYDDACDATDVAGNAQLDWLFAAEDIILPGPYLVTRNTSFNRLYSSNVARASQTIASRLGKNWASYLMYKYLRNTYRPQSPANTGTCGEQDGDYDFNCYLSEQDLRVGLETPAEFGAAAVVIYGGMSDVDNGTKCDAFKRYFEAILGPTVRSVVQGASIDWESAGR